MPNKLIGNCFFPIRRRNGREDGRASWPGRPPFLLPTYSHHRQPFSGRNKRPQARRCRLPDGPFLKAHEKLVEVHILDFQFKFIVACHLRRGPRREGEGYYQIKKSKADVISELSDLKSVESGHYFIHYMDQYRNPLAAL
jgi:hypothetical protein